VLFVAATYKILWIGVILTLFFGFLAGGLPALVFPLHYIQILAISKVNYLVGQF
jgi:hypothetical protein